VDALAEQTAPVQVGVPVPAIGVVVGVAVDRDSTVTVVEVLSRTVSLSFASPSIVYWPSLSPAGISSVTDGFFVSPGSIVW